MEKKNYIQPAIEMLEMTATPILAGSFELNEDERVTNPLSNDDLNLWGQ